MVSPEILTAPELIVITDVEWPATVSRFAPGPVIVTLWLISSVPFVSVTVPIAPAENWIVSPSTAGFTACRSEPVSAALSEVSVTL